MNQPVFYKVAESKGLGYPQPEQMMEWKRVTYSREDFCAECEITVRQVAPFRLKRTGPVGRNALLGLHWKYDAFFAPTSVYDAIYKRFGVDAIEVHDTRGRLRDDLVQLVTPARIPVKDATEIGEPEVCATCGTPVFAVQQTTVYPAIATPSPGIDFAFSAELYHPTRVAHRHLYMSERLVQEIVGAGLRRPALFKLRV